jgi:hypothetical protein
MDPRSPALIQAQLTAISPKAGIHRGTSLHHLAAVADRALERVPRESSVRVTWEGAPSQPRSGKLFHMEHPMESKEKNSHLFYLMIALIVLGFIISLAFPINGQDHKLTDTSHFAEHFVPA